MNNILLLSLAAFIVVISITIIPSLLKHRDNGFVGIGSILNDPKFVVFAVGATAAGLAWSVRQLVAALTLRTEMAILETLSDGLHRSHQEIIDAIQTHHRDKQYYKNLPVIRGSVTDALASLVSKQRVCLINGKYAVANDAKASGRS